MTIYELLKNYAIVSHAVGHTVGRVHMLHSFASTYGRIKDLPAVQAKILELLETISTVKKSLNDAVVEIQAVDLTAYGVIHEDFVEQNNDLAKSAAILKELKRTLH